MPYPFNPLPPELLPFATTEEKRLLVESDISTESKHNLLAELKSRCDLWRASLQVTEKQLLDFMGNRNRATYLYGGQTAEQRSGLRQGAESLWRAAQKPPDWTPDTSNWSPEAVEWFEEQQRSGRLFKNEDEVNAAHIASQRPFYGNYSPSSDGPDWTNRPEVIHLSIEDEGRAVPTGSPEDNENDEDTPSPKVGTQQHPITPDIREEIERQGKWGVDWPQKSETQPDQSPKPKKGVDLSELIKAFEAEENSDTSTPDISSLNDSIRKFGEQMAEEDRRLADLARNTFNPPTPEAPKWEDEYPPPLVEYVREENKRRQAKEEARIAGLARALDYANRQAEDRARSEREAREFARRLGSTPINETPPTERKSWIHRIPVWKDLGHWLRWASIWAGAAVTATGFGEYAVALVLLALCLSCCIVQIFVWQTNRHWLWTLFLAFVSLGIIGYGVAVVLDQKGDKKWGVLWPKEAVLQQSVSQAKPDWKESDESKRIAFGLVEDIQKLVNEGRVIDTTNLDRVTATYEAWNEKYSVVLGQVDNKMQERYKQTNFKSEFDKIFDYSPVGKGYESSDRKRLKLAIEMRIGQLESDIKVIKIYTMPDAEAIRLPL